MKGPVQGIVVVLALFAGSVIFLSQNTFVSSTTASFQKSYANDLYGIFFSYPQGYVLSERTEGPFVRRHHTISLIEDKDTVPRLNGEGPTAITIDIYDNTSQQNARPMTLLGWISTDESNAYLGNGIVASTTVDGTPALTYRWDGLYQAQTTAFLHKGHIIAVSVTYQSPADPIYATYQSLVASLRLK